jgi:hypothetical protein
MKVVGSNVTVISLSRLVLLVYKERLAEPEELYTEPCNLIIPDVCI